MARLETTVDNGRLRIGTKREERKAFTYSTRFDGTVTVYITVPAIEELSVSGSGQLKTEGDLKAEALSLGVSGSGQLTVPKLTADKLQSTVSGSGEITVAGTCPQHEARISGSGNVRASDLRTEASAIRISGSGDGRLYARRSLEASIAGSGDVYVRGGANVKSKIAGRGRVHQE
nr:head GIN domain-containing protein [Hymenobacter psychrotolerans]